MQTSFSRLGPLGAIAAAVSLVSAGCIDPTLVRESRDSAVPHVPKAPISVTTSNGSVSVIKAPVQDVKITAKLGLRDQDRLTRTKVTADRGADGGLVVGVAWADGAPQSNEQCSFTIEVPDASGVTVKTSNGSVTITGLSGNANLSTSNGSVSANSHSGPVRASSSNGSLTVSLTPETTGPVDLSTSNGSITLTVGPSFQGALDTSTSNGAVKCDGSLDSIRSGEKKAARFGFSKSGDDSKARTSNGSITIHKAN